MSTYVRRVREFDARQYTPNASEFDVQGYVDWIMSFSTNQLGGVWPNNVTINEDGTLSVTWEEGAGYTWTNQISDGDYAFIQVIPDTPYVILELLSEEEFNKNYQLK